VSEGLIDSNRPCKVLIICLLFVLAKYTLASINNQYENDKVAILFNLIKPKQ